MRRHQNRPLSYNPKKCNCFACILLTLAIVVLAAISIYFCTKGIYVDVNDKTLCKATSVFVSRNKVSSVVKEVPTKACITKIYASIAQSPDKPIDIGTIQIYDGNNVIFQHSFSKNPAVSVGEFETTLVKPLCVSSEGSSVKLISARGSTLTAAQTLTLTVVYCPGNCQK